MIFSERDDSLSNKYTGASRSSVRAEGGVSEEIRQDLPKNTRKSPSPAVNDIVAMAAKEKAELKKEHVRRKS